MGCSVICILQVWCYGWHDPANKHLHANMTLVQAWIWHDRDWSTKGVMEPVSAGEGHTALVRACPGTCIDNAWCKPTVFQVRGALLHLCHVSCIFQLMIICCHVDLYLRRYWVEQQIVHLGLAGDARKFDADVGRVSFTSFADHR